jgi:peptidoglycan/xylan/chitin deacetylase (PgdA/CDA1 family)
VSAEMSSAAVVKSTAVLSFHKVGNPPQGGWDTWNYIAEDRFATYLEQLRDECYHILDLHSFLNGVKDPRHLPERSALLTFDDGYRSMLTTTQPLLNRFGYPSVVFVPTDHIGGFNTWDYGNEPEEPICSWSELVELQHHGVSIQSHGVTHRSFSELDRAAQEYEIKVSKERLEEKLGAAVDTLAFPYGDNGKDVQAMELALKRAGYQAAFLYKGGVFDVPTETPFRVTRVPMGPDTNLLEWLGIGA